MLTVQFPSFRNSRGSHTDCFCAELIWEESVCESFSSATRLQGFHRTRLVGATVFFLKARGCAQAAPFLFWFVGFFCCCENQTVGCEIPAARFSILFRLYLLNGSSVFLSETCVGTARPSAVPTHFSDRKTVQPFARYSGEKISSKWSLKESQRKMVLSVCVTFLGLTFRKVCVFSKNGIPPKY